MGRFGMSAVVGLALLAGCGGEGAGRRATGTGPAAGAVSAVTRPPVPSTSTASTEPTGTSAAAPPSTAAPGKPPDLVDLAAVDALLAEADRALVEAEPAAEDEPAR